MTLTKFLLLFSFISFVVFGCNADKKNKESLNQKVEKNIEIDEEIQEDLGTAKRVFYSLPSPIETAMLIKRADTKFDPQLLNPTANAEKYNSTAKKALNFGVYGADLSYANLFSQTQITIEYMSVSKRLADEMGILSIIDENIVKRLETNINNRDSSMHIITETFMSSNAQLKEAGRPEIAALIIAGGWIEGLYIATSLTKYSPNNNELIDRIMDQKLSLITLRSLLLNYENSKDVKHILILLDEIKAVYDQIQIVTSKVEPITNSDSKMTTLQAKTEIFASQAVFDELCHKADSIRTVIIGL